MSGFGSEIKSRQHNTMFTSFSQDYFYTARKQQEGLQAIHISESSIISVCPASTAGYKSQVQPYRNAY